VLDHFILGTLGTATDDGERSAAFLQGQCVCGRKIC
jgi:hypothetical protein